MAGSRHAARSVCSSALELLRELARAIADRLHFFSGNGAARRYLIQQALRLRIQHACHIWMEPRRNLAALLGFVEHTRDETIRLPLLSVVYHHDVPLSRPPRPRC